MLGGLWGAWFIKLNEGWESFRSKSGLADWPVTEVALLALFTAIVSYLIPLSRVPSTEFVGILFQDCKSGDPFKLCE